MSKQSSNKNNLLIKIYNGKNMEKKRRYKYRLCLNNVLRHTINTPIVVFD